jgi:hypothetical protein
LLPAIRPFWLRTEPFTALRGMCKDGHYYRNDFRDK